MPAAPPPMMTIRCNFGSIVELVDAAGNGENLHKYECKRAPFPYTAQPVKIKFCVLGAELLQ
jgi:hypothetical protein